MQTIEIFCENSGEPIYCAPGATLLDLTGKSAASFPHRTLAALVDNKLKELRYAIYQPHNVRFIDIAHPDGQRTYQRSLVFLLQKAVRDLLPDYQLQVKYTVLNGLYCELAGSNKVVNEQLLQQLEERMRELVAEKKPFVRKKLPTEKAIAIFKQNNQPEKALLQQTRGHFYTSVYYIDAYPDHMHGPLVPSSDYLSVFALTMYQDGFVLLMPNPQQPEVPLSVVVQPQLFDIFQENKEWIKILGAHTIGSINRAIQQGDTKRLILVSESLHEKKYAQLADEIQKREKVRLVLIAGPSSSGKTTSSKRLAVQAQVVGLNPVLLEMDNYFVNREHTPCDAEGNYNFEDIHALDLSLLNQHLQDLLAGKDVHIPTFNFSTGNRSFADNNILKMGPKDVLIMEGIHALNPILTEAVPNEMKYKIYCSALTSVSVDENNRISTTDNRLIRRIIRDSWARKYTASETIMRWPSVRHGEDCNVFPYQENADIMFNSALTYETYVLRRYAEPLLRRIKPTDPAYSEAVRLLRFLSYFEVLPTGIENDVPSNSILREFISGSVF
ncbi:MAG: nucleoside kinase [Prevotellaceae bacterium]|jgi:uridine kinase|nr:nucleoside kinase [Prevotellaceae bacterium]